MTACFQKLSIKNLIVLLLCYTTLFKIINEYNLKMYLYKGQTSTKNTKAFIWLLLLNVTQFCNVLETIIWYQSSIINSNMKYKLAR